MTLVLAQVRFSFQGISSKIGSEPSQPIFILGGVTPLAWHGCLIR